MLELNHPQVQFALQAVTQASLLARQVQAEMASHSLTKDDCSPVTVADFAAQALVAYYLQQSFPGQVLVAEETSAALQQPEMEEILQRVCDYVQRFIPTAMPESVCRWIDHGAGHPEGSFWVLDPIDGTKGFLRRGQYAVALAYVEQGQVMLGVLGCPHLRTACHPEERGRGSLVAAQRGRGTWAAPLNGHLPLHLQQPEHFTRLSVSECTDPAQARLLRSYEAAHTNTAHIDRLVQHLSVQASPLRLDSQAKYAMLAAGCGEAMVRLPPDEDPDYCEKIWDQAAGALVVEESGGQISDLAGNKLDFTAGRTLRLNRGVLASNGRLHPALLAGLHFVGK
jgi:3'(2'), 5'-bisphosphate nucleotidase